MSIADLTRNCFQSGVSAPRWVKLCQLYVSKNGIESTPDVEHQISNSVLILYRSYPGEPDLVEYFRQALQESLVSLPVFVSTFLQAAFSPEIRTSASLDMLCRVALDAHYSSNAPPVGSVVPVGATSAAIMATVKDALSLLRSASTLPPSHFHQLSTSASELATLLISCITDLSQVPVAQAMVHLSEVNYLLQTLPLSNTARQIFQTYSLSLDMVAGADVKAAHEAQMMQNINASTYGKGEFSDATSNSDIVSFGLLLHHLVHNRGAKYGSGSGGDPVVLLLETLRWSSWTPAVFYTQLISSAFTCLSQTSGNKIWLWVSFIAGRLPSMISQFEATIKSDSLVNADWRSAVQTALSNVLRRSELMAQCDHLIQQLNLETPVLRSASGELLAGLINRSVIDSSFAVGIDVRTAEDSIPRLKTEARDAGHPELQPYITFKISLDASLEEVKLLASRVWLDPTSHETFARVIMEQAAKLTTTLDVESMSHLCKLLLQHETALDIISLHEPISSLVYHALKFIETYDCETVGDPQTAVGHLGDVVLFAQYTMEKYHLDMDTFAHGANAVSSQFIKTVRNIYGLDELTREEMVAFNSWFKTLFDSTSEGIEDSILRSTNPKILLRLAATLVSHAIIARMASKIDNDTLHNGVSFFLSPLLNWTLVGVVKSLLREIKTKGFNAPVHFDILQTILLSPSCPPTVHCLCGAQILTQITLLNVRVQTASSEFKFDVRAIRQLAARAVGYIEPATMPTPKQQGLWPNQPRNAILMAIGTARGGKAPHLDVKHCLDVTPPAKFLQLLWSELVVAAGLGEMDMCRRIATYVLTMPQPPQTPPLLPIFLYIVLPSLIVAIDNQNVGEQTLGTELLFNIVTSSLTAALHLEWALRAVGGEPLSPLGGQPSTIMARRLGVNLRMKKNSRTSRSLLHKLTSSQPFMANFPHFMSEINI
ncbi:mediator complex subunit [Pleurotus ostreatus]|uniref:Mediator of RNA polymerase II transcription subunit 5 n=1 Tax=Pleurotus ostreatus TaxID=5322 RepID=A0A8H7DU64_PLEOS|nr:mediator complex subunit [Pleurotus ostreatus]KAF7436894.1 mediator complex subunit [Pleurotus ostreatus]